MLLSMLYKAWHINTVHKNMVVFNTLTNLDKHVRTMLYYFLKPNTTIHSKKFISASSLSAMKEKINKAPSISWEGHKGGKERKQSAVRPWQQFSFQSFPSTKAELIVRLKLLTSHDVLPSLPAPPPVCSEASRLQSGMRIKPAFLNPHRPNAERNATQKCKKIDSVSSCCCDKQSFPAQSFHPRVPGALLSVSRANEGDEFRRAAATEGSAWCAWWCTRAIKSLITVVSHVPRCSATFPCEAPSWETKLIRFLIARHTFVVVEISLAAGTLLALWRVRCKNGSLHARAHVLLREG